MRILRCFSYFASFAFKIGRGIIVDFFSISLECMCGMWDGVTDVKKNYFSRNSLQIMLTITTISFFSFFNSAIYGVTAHFHIFVKVLYYCQDL